jgi:hypothetical protein
MTTGPSAKPTMPPAVKRPMPRVAFFACEPAIVVPIGCRAADPSPSTTSNTKTSQSSEATPIRLKNVDAIKTPTHPINRNPDVLAERTEDGVRHRRGDPEHRNYQGEGSGARIETHLKSREQRTQIAVIASLTVWTSVMKTARIVPPRMPGFRIMWAFADHEGGRRTG